MANQSLPREPNRGSDPKRDHKESDTTEKQLDNNSIHEQVVTLPEAEVFSSSIDAHPLPLAQ